MFSRVPPVLRLVVVLAVIALGASAGTGIAAPRADVALATHANAAALVRGTSFAPDSAKWCPQNLGECTWQYSYTPSHWSYLWSYTGYNFERSCPSTSCGLVNYWENYHWALMHCWVNWQWATGNYSTNRWFYVTVPGQYYGQDGWVHASLVWDQAWTPRCW
jgi:hypothetical protein